MNDGLGKLLADATEAADAAQRAANAAALADVAHLVAVYRAGLLATGFTVDEARELTAEWHRLYWAMVFAHTLGDHG